VLLDGGAERRRRLHPHAHQKRHDAAAQQDQRESVDPVEAEEEGHQRVLDGRAAGTADRLARRLAE
jgi:hypothetical protein